MRRNAARAVMIAGLLVLTGCHDVLFPKDQPRSQFEAHDRMRGGYVPLERPDVFGEPQPNLRGRLSRD